VRPDYAHWRQTAEVFTRESRFILEQFDELESGLEPDEWAQVVGRGVALRYVRTSWSNMITFMVTTRALYARKRGVTGWGRTLMAQTKGSGAGRVESAGPFFEYGCETAQGHLSLTVGTREAAEAVGRALARNRDCDAIGAPHYPPGSPEGLMNDAARTRARAASVTPEQYAGLVGRLAQMYRAGRHEDIWALRCSFGFSVGEAMFAERGDWYWFNAYAALAGLHLGKPRAAPLSVYCGQADAAADRSDEREQAVTSEINRAFAGG
jgi:hypothetical protein